MRLVAPCSRYMLAAATGGASLPVIPSHCMRPRVGATLRREGRLEEAISGVCARASSPALPCGRCSHRALCFPHVAQNHILISIPRTASLIPEILLLVEQIRPRTTQIYNLRAAVPVLLESRALEAVESVRDAFAAAHDALVLVVAERALVADAYESGGAHVGVADRALAVAFVAETADGDAAGFAAHDEIWVMAGHGGGGLRGLFGGP